MSAPWRMTHLILDREWGPEAVMLTDEGVAYTRDEWEESAVADYEYHEGEWRRQGQPVPGAVYEVGLVGPILIGFQRTP